MNTQSGMVFSFDSQVKKSKCKIMHDFKPHNLRHKRHVSKPLMRWSDPTCSIVYVYTYL